MAPDENPHEGGLRALHKRRSRQHIAEVAAELFDGAPYDSVTVDQIAAAAEVSARTVFRYFANKEDLALAQLAEIDARYLDNFDRRPRSESLLESLRFAMHQTWAEQSASASQQRYLRLLKALETEPGLSAANLRRTSVQENRLVARAAGRLSGEDAELLARLSIAAFGAAVRVAEDRWREARNTDIDALQTQIDSCILRLVPALLSAAAASIE